VLRLGLALALSQVGFHAFVASLPVALLAAGRGDAEIGALMGVAALMQIAAAFVAGGLIDRFGGRRVFLGGSAAFAVAAGLLASGLAAPAGATWLLVVVRLLQGIGLAACAPAAYSLVPGLVSAQRVATALSFAGMAANVSLAASPPISLALLGQGSLVLVATVTLASVLVGMALLWPTAAVQARARSATVGTRPRTFRPAWRRAWLAPLAVSALFVAHWGVVTGYLPQRAEAYGADVGFFFTADAVSIMLLRVPGAALQGRLGSRAMMLAGVAATFGALALLLLLPPSTPILIVAGLGTGSSGALILPAIMVEISNRSSDDDRGSGFALFSVAFSVGIAAGSIGLAPLIDTIGWQLALGAGMASLLLSGVVVLLDPSLRTRLPAAAGA
jgi:MFS family permease